MELPHSQGGGAPPTDILALISAFHEKDDNKKDNHEEYIDREGTIFTVEPFRDLLPGSDEHFVHIQFQISRNCGISQEMHKYHQTSSEENSQ